MYNIDKGRENTKNSENIGIKESTRESVCRSVKDNGGSENNYGDYMITEPIDCDEELERIPRADYELCTALLTMLLREDHFFNGSFERRFSEGQVIPVLVRMKDVLKNET